MVIAIAGMGPVGRTIVDTLLETPEYQKQVAVLTRKKEASSLPDQVEQIEVDYNDVSSLAASLEKHNIDTVICTIGMVTPEAGQSQVNLIQAAEKSSVTKRFIPSEYSFVQSEEILHITPGVQLYIDAINALKETKLKYTRILPGYFMDYWGMPNTRTHLKPLAYGVDIPSGRALIPGDGNNVITLTHSYDMAKFIVKLLGAEEWPELAYMGGDDLTFNELLSLAEEIRGTKFEVSYDSLEKVKKNESTPLPQSDKVVYPPEIISWIVSYMSQVVVIDGFSLPKENRVNNMFPDVKPVAMREFLAKAWKA
ncbi:hypothetical protein MGYG_05913 [Nannizzia gypsea CBS 118893]|uniref:NAD(P)-binding domain-containing protein n=1 Tax=Arthroderma gypseum (strain ATCC MYA-4604 / CBS 118893) TaxID=535722 RepID=E4UZX5_ARTGP|nr:hypothetical protein MGYG_05913 [Nannizzia gypsea CBS 118893]EFR02912.1 hypothetical protein MGYG_05913 [Nannizzia gypsea CBS 118893]